MGGPQRVTEGSESEKENYRRPFYEESKKTLQINLQNTRKLTDLENELTVTEDKGQ